MKASILFRLTPPFAVAKTTFNPPFASSSGRGSTVEIASPSASGSKFTIGRPACLRCAFGQLPYLHTVDFAVSREKQDGCGVQFEVTNSSVTASSLVAIPARPSPRLRTECGKRRPFDIAAVRNGNDHFLAFHQIFIVKTIPGCGNFA